MRTALALLLFAVLCLTASTALWLHASKTTPTSDSFDPGAAIARFESSEGAQAIATNVDIQALYAGRLDLLDPGRALPTWHEHPRDEAVRVYKSLAQCPPPPLSGIADASLAKAYEWHAAICNSQTDAEEKLAVGDPPFIHPSGKSYAALLLALGPRPASWVHDHARAFHVLELASLDANALPPEQRALATLSAHAWEELTRGDRLVLTKTSLVVAEHGLFGLAKLRVYPRSAWETFAANAEISLFPRVSSAICARPASPELCWEPRTSSEHRKAMFVLGAMGSALLTVLASIALGIAYVRERRRAHRDRIHVLRTLTHELRTPATSLRLDIEPLRAAYDDLPLSCQEPTLRISDGIERLHRVLHLSARYMALFETHGGARAEIVKVRDVPSTRELFEEFAEEWPDGVTLTAASKDEPLSIDATWLGLAVKNLVENGARHGVFPVVVTWVIDGEFLVVRVGDGGKTPDLSLRRATTPFGRAEDSPGLGLGLAIVDRVTELLGGRLSHEPNPTVFQIRVPKGGRS